MVTTPTGGEPIVERFELRLRMDATLTIRDNTGKESHWVKPGSEAAVFWNGIPGEAELALRYEALSQVAAATLEAVIVQSAEELRKHGLH
jgi:hypothetical protein